ncbi:hypothetical protein ZIOFF_071709 [Zingiber officinale]|uniref:Reverse transcriptase Ty1/copia-type domain-containing protein n=1 Tax=Zingiber officinale TaxID=94328 RepID=A0A8J5CA09_ZINOF|nr:hypothetical protein ZIOFF_071709 [Zingiber officinale]
MHARTAVPVLFTLPSDRWVSILKNVTTTPLSHGRHLTLSRRALCHGFAHGFRKSHLAKMVLLVCVLLQSTYRVLVTVFSVTRLADISKRYDTETDLLRLLSPFGTFRRRFKLAAVVSRLAIHNMSGISHVLQAATGGLGICLIRTEIVVSVILDFAVCENSFTIILLYVDDMIIVGNDQKAINNVKAFLATCFKLKDLGMLKYFLGIEVARSTMGISINQRKYTLDLLQEVGLLGAKSANSKRELEWYVEVINIDGLFNEPYDETLDPTYDPNELDGKESESKTIERRKVVGVERKGGSSGANVRDNKKDDNCDEDGGWIALKYSERFRMNPKLDAKNFKNQVMHENRFFLSKSQGYRAKKKALAIVRGLDSSQYGQLYDYAIEIQRSNPGSTVVIKLEDDFCYPKTGQGRFQRMVIAYRVFLYERLFGQQPSQQLIHNLKQNCGRSHNVNCVETAVATTDYLLCPVSPATVDSQRRKLLTRPGTGYKRLMLPPTL